MPPIDQGGDNFRYVLYISRNGNNPLDFVRTIPDWRQDRFEYQTNDSHVPYNVTIRAANEYGYSEAPVTTHVVYSG